MAAAPPDGRKESHPTQKSPEEKETERKEGRKEERVG